LDQGTRTSREVQKSWQLTRYTQFGEEARTHGIKGLIFVGAHWEELDDRIRVATKTKPDVVQMDMVPRSYWENYQVNIDVSLARRVVHLLRSSGFTDVEEDPEFDWHDDTITPARWMFPEGTPPATVVSLNARYNPVFHVKIGRALRVLRKEGYLLCGTGGAVHNLYRNNWLPVLAKGDNFQPGRKPAKWAIEFEKSVSDVVANTKARDSLPRLFLTLPNRDLGCPSRRCIGSVDQGSAVQGRSSYG
jgi:aromatic ring-opening dioxygenase catalytic subunit (LigB family)